jgi:hypothetical protein
MQIVCSLAGFPGGMWHTVVFFVSVGSQARGSGWPGVHTCGGPLSALALEPLPLPLALTALSVESTFVGAHPAIATTNSANTVFIAHLPGRGCR